MKRIVVLTGCFILLLMLGACTDEKRLDKSKFEEQYYEGKSDNWYVKLEVKTDSTRNYIISYVGEGSRPSVFNYEIDEDSYNLKSGEGELEKQQEFEMYTVCSGTCERLPQEIPIKIQWEGKTEEFIIENKK